MSYRRNSIDSDSQFSDEERRTKILGVFAGIGNNCNNMVGAGIFSSPGLVLHKVQSPGIALILWLIGGIVALCGSLSYVELGSSLSDGGGETIYLKTAFPRPRALLSYMFSFTMIVAIRPGAISADANVVAQYFVYMATAKGECENSDELHPKKYLANYDFWRLRLISLLVVWIITIYHIISNKWANRINQTLTTIKMTTLLVISGVGLAAIKRSISESSSTDPSNWKNLFPNVGIGARSLTGGLIPILFAYNGWNNLNYTLDEFVDPQKKLLVSNTISVGIVTILYLLANIAYTNVPLTQVTGGSDPSEIIAGQFALNVGGLKLARALSFFVCLSAFGALAAMMWSGSRVIVAAAKANYIPIFSPWLTKWNSKTDTPINALIAQSVWCSVIILFCPYDDPFQFLVVISEYTSWVFFGLSALGLLVLRKRQPDLRRPFKVFRIFPILFICFALFIIFGSFVNDDETTLDIKLPKVNVTLNNSCGYGNDDGEPSYAYYLPYTTSLIVIAISAICWYFLFHINWRNRLSQGENEKSNHEDIKNDDRLPLEAAETIETIESNNSSQISQTPESAMSKA
ncbi:5183_t:CDS:2 [Ambispora gerdemannii]|uniref:5183_t:CDS:1 n=1 Tax=Ambispora gerdemannii TaxID=144530 RepID=A0A9N9ADQ6_9GLOM|nr:5183_t:CDS:2 [Ambispora gerdemannii]